MLYCTVTQEPGHGGISRVSSLVWEIVRSRYGAGCALLTASGAGRDSPDITDKIGFTARAIALQLQASRGVLFFDHIGLARVQTLLPRSLRRPYGIFLHSIEAWDPLSPNRLKALQGASVRIANSHYTANRIARAHPSVGPIDVCPLTLGLNLLDENPFSPPAAGTVQQEIVDKIAPNSVLIVGRIMKGERYKGHDELIRAWPRVVAEVPDAQLVIVGSGDDLDRLQAAARESAVGSHILFTGFVSEETLRILYERAAVFAMPSRAEGFGLVYLEAMSRRLPCIGSIHDAAVEVIVDGETGYLVDQDDPGDLAEKLVRLLKDPGLRKEFGRKGFERARSRFSLQQFQEGILKCLDKLSAVQTSVKGANG